VAALPDDVLAWIGDVTGGTVSAAHRQQGGARKEAWFIDVVQPDGHVDELFLRYERATGALFDPWGLEREASVYLALQGTAVPVPGVLGVHPARPAMLSERVGGQTWFSRISDPDEAERTASAFMACLAALHRLDAAALSLPGFPRPTRAPDLVHHELDEWEAVLARRGGEPDPALVFVLGWLRRNVPDYDGPVVLVQGDTGPGNFLYEDGRVVAVVDWELAHLGDPMDDIAWLTLRCTQEPFPDLPARLREYEELSGYVIDEARVRYYQVAAETKLQVMHHGAGGPSAGGGGGRDTGNALIYEMLHRRLWLEALAGPVGFELTPAEPLEAREPEGSDWLYEDVLGQLRDVIVPSLRDPFAIARAKGTARVVKYLASVERHGGAYARHELDDSALLLGAPQPSLRAARSAVAAAARSGPLGDVDYLRYLWRRTARDNELMRPASGVLADRHWPPLR
jgi:aminoglycoside phosphotransferase (APT) family kinase protein